MSRTNKREIKEDKKETRRAGYALLAIPVAFVVALCVAIQILLR